MVRVIRIHEIGIYTIYTSLILAKNGPQHFEHHIC